MGSALPPLRPKATVLVTASLAALLVLAAHTAASSSFGDVVWPPDELAERQQLANMTVHALEDDSPLVLGSVPLISLDVERVNESVSGLTFLTERGVAQVLQRHRPASLNGGVLIDVAPGHILPLIEVGTNYPDSSLLLKVAGPPDSFNVTDYADPTAQATEMARKLGLEGLGVGDKKNASVEWIRNPNPASLRLYQGVQGCIERSLGSCTESAAFAVRCSECFEVVRVLHPRPGEQLTEVSNGTIYIQRIYNQARFLFANTGHLIAVQVSLHLDLDTSTMLPPDQAVGLVRAHITNEGLSMGRDSSLDAGSLLISTGSVETITPDAARYLWTTKVVNASEVSGNASGLEGRVRASIVQDAITGEILSSSFDDRPAVAHLPVDFSGDAELGNRDLHDSPSPEGPKAVPTLGLVSLFLALVIAAFFRSRN